jgi:hypothetical protein
MREEAGRLVASKGPGAQELGSRPKLSPIPIIRIITIIRELFLFLERRGVIYIL